ncbi:MAG: hypothetical protein NVSMB25_14670 [Thermoleophilaceae bacterium]
MSGGERQVASLKGRLRGSELEDKMEADCETEVPSYRASFESAVAPFVDGEAMAEARPTEIIERATEAAREMLGMEMAYLAGVRDGIQECRAVAGGGSFGIVAGQRTPHSGTYCEMMLDGRLDNVVSDSASDPRVRGLEVTASFGVRSYVGVPVVLSDGSTYGTFCCISHEPNFDLRTRDVQFMRVLARLIADQLQRAEHDAEQRRLAIMSSGTSALLAALSARDGYTEAHSVAVVETALMVGTKLGLESAAIGDLESAALLHDIGKIGVPDVILRKPGKLTEDEWVEMRRHPEIGERIIAGMAALAHLAPVIRAEHERYDGGGYPDGLAGEEIPLASRIVFVCDAYHAMTSDRPYRTALGKRAAIRELNHNAGTQFCPKTVAAINALSDAL